MSHCRQKLVILGATGSIGVNTLDVVGRHPDRFEVFALSAHNQVERLAEQCIRFRSRHAVVGTDQAATRLKALLDTADVQTLIHVGIEALEWVAGHPEADTVVAAIVGAAGLRPTIAAARNGKKILLANKEALVMAGPVFMDEVYRHGATVLPIDSEHNAIYQSLPRTSSSKLSKNGVCKIILTASGGPLRNWPAEDLEKVTPEQACAHPNWVMGRKISVDSASMMNKGLEVIEAHWLFDVSPAQIEVVIHPQSIVHSMVEYIDGSVIAQLGNPDMRTPIAYALAHPERIGAGVAPLDLCRTGVLNFEPPDLRRFPCLGLAYAALEKGGNAPAVLNAANEVAVEAFLNAGLAFTRIPEVIRDTLAHVPWQTLKSLEDVLAADLDSREAAQRFVRTSCH